MLINLASQYAPWLPSRLFANGQQGLWYVPQPVYRGQQVLFQDAAGTTPVTADGDPVGLMLDLSPNGNDASQSTSAARPLYRTDGTLHYLEFDGVDDYLDNGFSGVASEFSLSIASRYTNLSAIRLMAGDDTDDEFKFGFISASRDYFLRAASGAAAIDEDVTGYLDSDRVFSATRDISDLLEGFLGGALVGSSSGHSGLATFNRIGAGSDVGSPGFFMHGRIYAFVLAEGSGAGGREKLDRYTGKLAGITL